MQNSHRLILRSLLCVLFLAFAPRLQAAPSVAEEPALVALGEEWRRFAMPVIAQCVPDYRPAAMAEKAKGLRLLQSRLDKIGRAGLSGASATDIALLRAEMNGLDFDLRVLRPWARDPAFYVTVIGEQSDVPAHEGTGALPVIDLFRYDYPLSAADRASLTCLIGAVPALLDQARLNLRDSQARDLWVYGVRQVREQSAVLADFVKGSLEMRTLDGPKRAFLTAEDDELRQAALRAQTATDAFADWLDALAPSKTGPSGVGKANYSWYQKNVHLVPYDWDQQVTLVQRELQRAHASLRLEEFRNRDLPPLEPVTSPAAFQALADARMAKLTDFLIHSGMVPDKDYFRDAMAQQKMAYVPPEKRNFFLHTLMREPLGLYSHDYHWIELARLRREPHADPLRRTPPLANIFDSRSEGLATALEETLMQAGLYDDDPRGREIVWIMLANRAARGLASLYVQANEMTLQQAGEFHARWTPRGWSDPSSPLVAFEQLLYLRQPGYGTSYIMGKIEFDRLIADASHQAEMQGAAFSFPELFRKMSDAGILPFSLVEQDLGVPPLDIHAK